MANPIKGEARLGDLTVAFNFGALCELEERTGKKVGALLQQMQEGLGFTELRDFTWAALQTHHRGITDEEVIQAIEGVGFEAAAVTIGQAIASFFSSQKEKVKNPPKAA